jgi:hypothetical protein
MSKSRHETGTDRSLLYLQIVFASFAALLNVPLDLLGDWLTGPASPSMAWFAQFDLLSGAFFAATTFFIWRWIMPHLRGALVLRIGALMLLGLALFSHGLLAAQFLEARLPKMMPGFAPMFSEVLLETGPSALVVICGATLYMLLGGLALGSAREEHQRLHETALRGHLEALRSQLNHHFLFNSLNVIAEAAAVQPDRVEKLILQLAGVLRYSLSATRIRMAPLSEELAAVASYLELERARSGNRINVETDIAPDVGSIMVPPLLIQPLVENAVGHGLMNGTCAGKITIAAWLNGEMLCIRVNDDGVGFDLNRSAHPQNTGVGLPNLRDRLRAFYGDAAAFQIHSSIDGGGTMAEVTLPRAIRPDQERPQQKIMWRTLFWSAASIASVIALAAALDAFKMGAARSITIGAAIELIYLLVAGAMDEVKTFDIAITALFLVGELALLAGWTDRFFSHSTMLLWIALAAVAIFPQALGAEPFTAYWMRRVYPIWLQRGASFARVSRYIATLWGIVFGALAVASYRSPVASAISPAYVALLGAMAGLLSAAYPKRLIYRGGLKRAAAEFFILGLPLMFRRKLYSELKMSAQFVVSGAEPGSYFVEIDSGRCVAGQGNIKEPSLTIYCANDSWNPISTGDITPEDALARRVLRITGSTQQFLQFLDCFSIGTHRRASRASAERHAA